MPLQCPLCKYSPKRKKDGLCRQNYKEFELIQVSHDIQSNYDCCHSFIGYVCPNCGIMFRNVKSLT